MALPRTIPVGLIGAGRIGSSHAEIIARRVPGASLVAVADPRPGVADALGSSLGARGVLSPEDVFGADDIEAVVIAASSDAHCELVVAAAAAGKAVFCEKPMSMTLPDAERAIAAARDAGVPLQVGFNRRFAADFVAAHAGDRRGRDRHPAADALADPRPGAGQPRRRTALDGVHPDPDPRLRRAAVAEPGREPGRGLRDGRCPGRAGVQGRGSAGHRRRGDHLRQRCPCRGRGELLRVVRL